MPVNPVPDGYHTVTAYLVVDGAGRAIDFYAAAFGATEMFRLPMARRDGSACIGHAEVKIGDTILMLSDEWPEMEALGPAKRGGATASFVVYVPDADAAIARALQAGARLHQPASDQFWGDRMGSVIDPFGHKWTLGTHIEDVPPEELRTRMDQWAKAQAARQP
jgi:PhnB protein